jgi:hypothetical protein
MSTGCEKSAAPAPTFTVRDSAGIEIVESAAPLLGSGAWRVSEEPVLQIGELEGDERYLFSQIAWHSRSGLGGVFRMEDGRIVVADSRERTVRFFDPSGEYLATFGGSGEGPGEFRGSPYACMPQGGGVAVVESRRVSFFDSEGRYLERADLPPTRPSINGLFPDRSILVYRRLADPQMIVDPPAGVHDDQAELRVLGPDGSASEWADTVLNQRRVVSREGDFPIQTIQPFGPNLVLRALGDGFVYGWGEEYEMLVHDRDGSLVRIVRRGGELTPVTEEDREWFRGGLPDDPDGRSLSAGLVFPEFKAAFDRALVDRVGHLWVRTLGPVAELPKLDTPSPYWEVFDSAGRWLTTMKLPSDVQIHEIGEDYILGVWEDELEIEYVRMYSLDRGT